MVWSERGERNLCVGSHISCELLVSVTETDFLGSNVVLYPQHRDSNNPGSRLIFNKSSSDYEIPSLADEHLLLQTDSLRLVQLLMRLLSNFGETSTVLVHFGKLDLIVFEKEWSQNKVQEERNLSVSCGYAFTVDKILILIWDLLQIRPCYSHPLKSLPVCWILTYLLRQSYRVKSVLCFRNGSNTSTLQWACGNSPCFPNSILYLRISDLFHFSCTRNYTHTCLCMVTFKSPFQMLYIISDQQNLSQHRSTKTRKQICLKLVIGD